MSDTVQEEMFRAGFYLGLHINDVFTDPDRPVQDNGYILVRKEDVNLELKKAKGMKLNIYQKLLSLGKKLHFQN